MPARMIHETPVELWVLSDQRTITLLDLVADLLEDGSGRKRSARPLKVAVRQFTAQGSSRHPGD
jgi:hypothetical protein